MSEKSVTTNYDIVIIGGGMVGATLAVALRNTGLSIAIVEAFEFKSEQQPSFDDRSIALSYGSKKIFDAMGVWSELSGQSQPIETIHVSDRGHFGVTRLYHDEEGVEALGYVIENRVLGQVMMDQLANIENIDLLVPATLESLTIDASQTQLQIQLDNQPVNISTKLLIAADGVNSKTRELLGIETRKEAYQQCAVITNVATSQFHKNVAYERFTDTGPIAFLPLTKRRCSVVWTINRDQQDDIMSLDDARFIEQLQERFGHRLGRITKAGKRSVYPLALTETHQLNRERTVIIGNAAHGLHPVSGQGFNLALRDVALLAEYISTEGVENPQSWLAEYVERRQDDMNRVFRFTDSLVKIFSNSFTPLAHARAAGLLVVDCLPALRHLLAKQSMGLTGRMSKMMRGMSI